MAKKQRRPNADVRVARTLLEVCASLASRSLPRAVPAPVTPLAVADLRDVRGQQQARRALEVAAADGHHLLLLGTPRCGKTLLASRLPGILPDATEAEALETATIASCTGNGIDTARWRHRPYRAPHHTASAVSLVGGGMHSRPGEISLAHNGVLFLDELPEWSRPTLEVLREPLESGELIRGFLARRQMDPFLELGVLDRHGGHETCLSELFSLYSGPLFIQRRSGDADRPRRDLIHNY